MVITDFFAIHMNFSSFFYRRGYDFLDKIITGIGKMMITTAQTRKVLLFWIIHLYIYIFCCVFYINDINYIKVFYIYLFSDYLIILILLLYYYLVLIWVKLSNILDNKIGCIY